MDKSNLPLLSDMLLPEMLEQWQQTLAWQPQPEQVGLFQQVYEKILQGNRQLNLTRITSADEFWEKHLWDSLRGIRFILDGTSWGETNHQIIIDKSINNSIHRRIIDIGTGAGFPGIPVAIALPQAQLNLVDSTQKKITFITTMVSELGLPNIKTITSRAETIGKDKNHRQTYDVALIRAVSAASVCAEYCVPLLKIGGIACIYKGQRSPQEEAALTKTSELLGAEVFQIEEFVTPLTQSQRTCIYLRKIANTPDQYPRDVGIPNQKPLFS